MRVCVLVCVNMFLRVFFLLVDVDGIVATGTHRFPFAAAAVRLYIVMPYRFIIQGICGVPGSGVVVVFTLHAMGTLVAWPVVELRVSSAHFAY